MGSWAAAFSSTVAVAGGAAWASGGGAAGAAARGGAGVLAAGGGGSGAAAGGTASGVFADSRSSVAAGAGGTSAGGCSVFTVEGGGTSAAGCSACAAAGGGGGCPARATPAAASADTSPTVRVRGGNAPSSARESPPTTRTPRSFLLDDIDRRPFSAGTAATPNTGSGRAGLRASDRERSRRRPGYPGAAHMKLNLIFISMCQQETPTPAHGLAKGGRPT
jgi:hypothetical protein